MKKAQAMLDSSEDTEAKFNKVREGGREGVAEAPAGSGRLLGDVAGVGG